MTCELTEDYVDGATDSVNPGKYTDSNVLNVKTGDLTVVVSDREKSINADMLGMDFTVKCTLDAATDLGTNSAQTGDYL
jgi:hypothetical protein